MKFQSIVFSVLTIYIASATAAPWRLSSSYFDLAERSDEYGERDFDLNDHLETRFSIFGHHVGKSKTPLHLTIEGTDSPATKKETEKQIKKILGNDIDKWPYCDVDFGAAPPNGRFRCFSGPGMKIGQQGPAGAIAIHK